jgi:hypothetical protein
LLNQIALLKNCILSGKVSESADKFLNNWGQQLEYINTTMRSIRKVQTDCELLNRCFNNPEIMETQHHGIVFDKILKNDGTIHYMVYLEKLRLLSRVVSLVNVENYSMNCFKLYLFEDEDKVKRKIRLQFV